MTAPNRVPSRDASVITDGWGRPKYIRVSTLVPASQHEWISELLRAAQDAGGVRVGEANVVVWALARIEREAGIADLTAEFMEWTETSRRSV